MSPQMRSLLNIGVATSCIMPLSLAFPAQAAPVPTAFTYQGQLKDGGAPADGPYDLRFSLYDAASGGNLVAGPLLFDGAGGNAAPVVVNQGLLSVALDFGSIFDGTALYLHIDVRPHNVGGYIALTPRQPLTATPFAMHALNSDSLWSAGAPGAIHSSDSVGIGTDTPAAKLHVAGDIRSDGAFGVAANNPNNPSAVAALGWFNDVARIRIGGDGPGATGGLDIQKTGDRSLMRLYDSGDVWFRAGLEATGDVLAKGGSLRCGHAAQPSEVFLGWALDANGNDMARIRIAGDGPGAYNGLDIQRPGNRSLMRIHDNGYVGLGTTTPAQRLSVEGSAYVSTNLGVGTSDPAFRLHILGGTGTALNGGGYAVFGPTTSQNVSIDNNEIMARSNGNTSTLYVNRSGGDVVFGGAIDINYQTVSSNTGVVTCPAGTKVIGGGCSISGDAEVRNSYPANNAWHCTAGDQSGFIILNAYAICANVK